MAVRRLVMISRTWYCISARSTSTRNTTSRRRRLNIHLTLPRNTPTRQSILTTQSTLIRQNTRIIHHNRLLFFPHRLHRLLLHRLLHLLRRRLLRLSSRPRSSHHQSSHLQKSLACPACPAFPACPEFLVFQVSLAFLACPLTLVYPAFLECPAFLVCPAFQASPVFLAYLVLRPLRLRTRQGADTSSHDQQRVTMTQPGTLGSGRMTSPAGTRTPDALTAGRESRELSLISLPMPSRGLRMI